jgi:hypothetical protein
MTPAQLARQLHAAEPSLSVRAIYELLTAQGVATSPQAVRSALGRSGVMGRPRKARCAACGGTGRAT